MGSRFINLLLGKGSNSNNNNNNHLRGQSYDTTVALNAPVQGSYPVAGNGPNVLEEIQRARAKRESVAASTRTIAGPALAPDIPRHRELPDQRPRTAPHNGEPGGGQQTAKKHKSGRTLSGFSMKSPPNIFSSSRRSSISSNHKREPVRKADETPPPLPSNAHPPSTYIPTYQPKTGKESSVRNGFAPPSAAFSKSHSRTTSTASHMSHIDLLDAHSHINRAREVSKHRAKASGVRNYGEDVADRNIDEFGHREKNRDSRLDLNSPEFSYLKQVYSPKKRQAPNRRGEPHSRVDSALGHVLGSDGSGDDTSSQTISYPRTSSIRSFTGPRPGVVYPPRTDSVNSNRTATTSGGEDALSSQTNGNTRGRALSPLSSSSIATASIREEPQLRTRSQGNQDHLDTSHIVSAPAIPLRGRTRGPSSTTQSTLIQNPPPVTLPPVKAPSATRGYEPSTSTQSKLNRRTMSTASEKAHLPSNGTTSRKSSISYSAFPQPSKRESQMLHSNISPTRSPVPGAPKDVNSQTSMAVEGASEAPSLEGIVDLKDSVDTDITTRTLPAVVHEHVTPTRHEIRKELITREIHTHDVYHRILPVIETKVLPTKHYIASADGKTLVEIPESDVPKHTISKTHAHNWHLGPGPASSCSSLNDRSSTDSAPDGPVIGLARGEPSTRPRGNSTRSHKSGKSTFSAKDILQPILSSKKETITKEGYPKTEYVWRHPPVFETSDGRTQPALIPAAFEGDRYYSSDDDDREGAEFGAERAEGDLLFRDSGYGNGGMLPGLPQPNHASTPQSIPRTHVGRKVEKSRKPLSEPVKDNGSSVGQATHYLRRMREKRQSIESGKGKEVNDLEIGMRGLNVNK